ncbi:uncharacterized protein NPIL_637441 [Nephila pilipes]|uniref:Uncharacterized protein n=1 Tax=Nephila pilipes TaxID=299642 RepID=A0A8X6QTB2_NEPPI|nr:uncharacterized protein NPIL_637441 [Nephila pilipes]
MRLLTKLDRQGSSLVPVVGCILPNGVPYIPRWVLAAEHGRMKLSSTLVCCLGYSSTSWAEHRYWSSSHRLKKFFFFFRHGIWFTQRSVKLS